MASPSVEVVEKSNERIVVKFNNIPRQYVNALRRLSIGEVPTLAVDDVDAAIAAMQPKLDGTPLIALERGMALEV